MLGVQLISLAIGDQTYIGLGRRPLCQLTHQLRDDQLAETTALMRGFYSYINDLVEKAITDGPAHANDMAGSLDHDTHDRLRKTGCSRRDASWSQPSQFT